MEQTSGIVNLFHQAMSSLSADLPKADIENVEELVGVGERKLAYEVLCTQIDEYDIPLSQEVMRVMEQLGKDLGMPPCGAGQLGNSNDI